VPARKIEKSIAVLPFQNLSNDPENAFFVDGVQEDISLALGKIADLKVISRTSVMSYRGAKYNVREIGKALGVGGIVEGTVRRSGNRVRVTVQLINASTDDHMCAWNTSAILPMSLPFKPTSRKKSRTSYGPNFVQPAKSRT
jgi:TolB-like protein